MKREVQRRVEEEPPIEAVKKESKRKLKARLRKDAFHQAKRDEAAMAIGLLPQALPAAAIGGSQPVDERDDALDKNAGACGAGKREAALAGADKTPTKADEVVADEAAPRSSGRKKAAGSLVFSNANDRRTFA